MKRDDSIEDDGSGENYPEWTCGGCITWLLAAVIIVSIAVCIAERWV